MFRAKFIVLAPVVSILLLLLKVEAAPTASIIGNDINSTTVKATQTTTVEVTSTPMKVNTTSATVTNGNSSTINPSATMTPPKKYIGPHFGGMVKRLVYVTLVLSAVIGFYFMVRFCRSGRRKPRKYGVIKTPGDMEMRPLESDDDDDDEDVTMFNRK